MQKSHRELIRLFESEGIEVVSLDPNRGKGRHCQVVYQYRGTRRTIYCSPDKSTTARHTQNFRADLRRFKREVDAKAS